MTVTVNKFPEYRVTLYHDAEAKPEPTCMHWFLHGVCSVVWKKPDETSEDLWLRTLAAINDERMRLTRSRSLLDPQAQCHVYAGELESASLEALKREHMRAHILSGLNRESGAKTSAGGSGTSRTAALALLARMTGVTKTRRPRA